MLSDDETVNGVMCSGFYSHFWDLEIVLEDQRFDGTITMNQLFHVIAKVWKLFMYKVIPFITMNHREILAG